MSPELHTEGQGPQEGDTGHWDTVPQARSWGTRRRREQGRLGVEAGGAGRGGVLPGAALSSGPSLVLPQPDLACCRHWSRTQRQMPGSGL